MNTLNVKIEGDYQNGWFTMFAVNIERNGIDLPIFLTAEQTNKAIEYDDEFEPILGLLNILLESGYSINQTIEIIHGDESEEQIQFLENSNRLDEGWSEEIQPIKLTYSNIENPDYGNINIESVGEGYSFTISTESNDQKPTELMNLLKSILSQN